MKASANRVQERLLAEAQQIEDALAKAQDRVHNLRTVRTHSMNRMHQAGISWAEIGRRYGVTPQAAMYATGHAPRTPAKPDGKHPPG